MCIHILSKHIPNFVKTIDVHSSYRLETKIRHDGHMDYQCEIILPHDYRVVEYKIARGMASYGVSKCTLVLF